MTKRGPSKKGDRSSGIPPHVLRPSGFKRRRSIGSFAVPVLGVVVLVLLALVVVSAIGGSNNGGEKTKHRKNAAKPAETTTGGTSAAATGQTTTTQGSRVSLALRATAPVWVCLVDATGHAVVPGETLTTGEARGPFNKRGFEVTFGNGSIQMTVNDQPAKVPPVAQPVGYRIDPVGVHKLDPASEPTCQ
jgi:cytoskeleton protein RodZ